MKDRLLDLLAQDVSEFYTYVCAVDDDANERWFEANGAWLTQWYAHKITLRNILLTDNIQKAMDAEDQT